MLAFRQWRWRDDVKVRSFSTALGVLVAFTTFTIHRCESRIRGILEALTAVPISSPLLTLRSFVLLAIRTPGLIAITVFTRYIEPRHCSIFLIRTRNKYCGVVEPCKKKMSGLQLTHCRSTACVYLCIRICGVGINNVLQWFIRPRIGTAAAAAGAQVRGRCEGGRNLKVVSREGCYGA